MEKKAAYSIGEFSKLSGLTVKTLRFYHERGLLEPAAIDHETGYRYYDQGNLETAYVVRALRDLEFSLSDISAVLADYRSEEDLLAHLERQKIALKGQLEHYQSLVDHIDQVISSERLQREATAVREQTFEIEEHDIEAVIVAGIKLRGRYQDCGAGFSKLGKRVGRFISGKPMLLCYDNEYREEDASFEPCFPVRKAVQVEGVETHTLAASHCLTLKHRGPYDTLSRSYARLMQYATRLGWEVQLPTREVYLRGPGMIFRGNPNKYLTEIQLPVVK